VKQEVFMAVGSSGNRDAVDFGYALKKFLISLGMFLKNASRSWANFGRCETVILDMVPCSKMIPINRCPGSQRRVVTAWVENIRFR